MTLKKFALCTMLFGYSSLFASVHPLQPLSYEEQIAAVAAVTTDLDETIGIDPDFDIFDQICLQEPKKSEVLAFQNGEGDLPAREALVTFWKSSTDTYLEYIVGLTGDTPTAEIVSKDVVKKARPAWTCADEGAVEEVAFANEEFRQALRDRGVCDEEIDEFVYLDVAVDGRLDDVPGCKSEGFDCPGPFREIDSCPKPHNFVVTPFWNDGDKCSTSAYIQPIEGVFAFVDRRTNEVTVVDTGVKTPIVKDTMSFIRPSRNTLKPLAVGMPEGVSFALDTIEVQDADDNTFTIAADNQIEWENWSIRFAFHPVTNLVFYDIKYKDYTIDKDREEFVDRTILYKANISEILTGYGSPLLPSRARNYFDFAEYPARDFTPPLIAGLDVPPYATLLSAPVTFSDGSTSFLPDVIGIYEQDGGLLWRHTDYPCFCDSRENLDRAWGRRNRQLVISTVAVIGNYDYTIFWTFNQDGRIDVEIKASGVVAYQGSKFARVNKHIKYGPLLHEYVLGVNHYHIFNTRLDFDIDGPINRVHESNILLQPVSEENPCGNGFEAEETLLTTEKEAVRDHDFRTFRTWAVENEHSHTNLGYHRGYELVPNPIPQPLVIPDSRIGKRGLFLRDNIFVTKYKDNEQYCAGQYLVERGHDQGLTKYIKDDENIVDEDIVLWYSTGFGHQPHVEEWPVMPAKSVKFSLVPHNFFEENPGLDVDPYKFVSCGACEAHCCDEVQNYE